MSWSHRPSRVLLRELLVNLRADREFHDGPGKADAVDMKNDLPLMAEALLNLCGSSNAHKAYTPENTA